VSKVKKLTPVSPGEMLMEEFLKPMGISKYRLAKEIGVPAQRIGEIVAGRRAITADTDLRLVASSAFPTVGGSEGSFASTWSALGTRWRRP
jgi:addiction module HigA family antidote